MNDMSVMSGAKKYIMSESSAKTSPTSTANARKGAR